MFGYSAFGLNPRKHRTIQLIDQSFILQIAISVLRLSFTENPMPHWPRCVSSLVLFLAASVSSLAQAPSPVQRLTQQGMEAYRRGDLPAAVAAFRQTTTIAPTDGLTWFNLGLVLADQGQLPEAASAYEKSISLLASPKASRLNLSNAYNNLALVYLRQNRFEEATTR